MRKKTWIIVSLSTLAALCWVSFMAAFIAGFTILERAVESSTGTIFVENANLESTSGVKVLDANNPFFQVTQTEPNRVDATWGETKIYQKGPCRVKKREKAMNTQVLGTLQQGEIYPVVIDSGFMDNMAVSDTIVLDAGLEIYPLPKLRSTTGGFCHLGKLTIGDLTIVHPPCVYTLAHYEKQILGRTIWKEKKILFGLKLMKHFSYILIDNINQEVEFDVKELFDPPDTNEWNRFPTTVESSRNGHQWLMVDIPLAGQTRHLGFDTGASSGLIIAKDVWDSISTELTILKTARNKLNMMHGFEPCDKITVKKINIGDLSLSNATIEVLDSDNPWGSEFFLLGMGYFQETIVVIDFERNLLWVRKTAQLPANSKSNS